MRSQQSCQKPVCFSFRGFSSKNQNPALYHTHVGTAKLSPPRFLESPREQLLAVMPGPGQQRAGEGERAAAPRSAATPQHDPGVLGAPRSSGVPGAARSALEDNEAQPGHRVPSSTHGASSQGWDLQQRRTWGDTTAPSCRAARLSSTAEPGTATALSWCYLLLYGLGYTARNEVRDVDCITGSLFEAYGTGHGWREEIGSHGTYVKISFPRKFRFST